MPRPAPVPPAEPAAPPASIRATYIAHLSACLTACARRGDGARAARAWALLVRCREVDWRARWHWGLYVLGAGHGAGGAAPGGPAGRQGETYLKTLQIASPEHERPTILHALVLHLIKAERHRDALGELETYLPSYPYLSSATLHTYAGMLALYLAQPASRRRPAQPQPAAAAPREPGRARGESVMTADSDDTANDAEHEPANDALTRQARAYFARACALDPADAVAREYMRMIDAPDGRADSDDELDGSERGGREDGGASSDGRLALGEGDEGDEEGSSLDGESGSID